MAVPEDWSALSSVAVLSLATPLMMGHVSVPRTTFHLIHAGLERTLSSLGEGNNVRAISLRAAAYLDELRHDLPIGDEDILAELLTLHCGIILSRRFREAMVSAVYLAAQVLHDLPDLASPRHFRRLRLAGLRARPEGSFLVVDGEPSIIYSNADLPIWGASSFVNVSINGEQTLYQASQVDRFSFQAVEEADYGLAFGSEVWGQADRAFQERTRFIHHTLHQTLAPMAAQDLGVLIGVLFDVVQLSNGRDDLDMPVSKALFQGEVLKDHNLRVRCIEYLLGELREIDRPSRHHIFEGLSRMMPEAATSQLVVTLARSILGVGLSARQYTAAHFMGAPPPTFVPHS